LTLFVLDASALLAMFRGEAGADLVLEALDQAVISSVNATEVSTRLSDLGYDMDEHFAELEALPLRIMFFDAEQARAAARLRPATKRACLSLADRACLALAQTVGGTALTTDRVWTELKVGVPIQLIR
jgi:PIN domain nuclease of toxin-antitoxin system